MPSSPPVTKKKRATHAPPEILPNWEDDAFHHVDVTADTPRQRRHLQQEKRRAGFRTAAWLIALFCFIAFIHVVWRHTLHQHPRFALKEAIIQTEGQLTSKKLARAMGLTIGMDTLWLNLRHTADKAKTLPQVKNASIRRDYEGHLFINITQRKPIAWLECENLGIRALNTGHSCLLDAEGIAIPCEIILKEYTALPVISIKDLEEPLMGRPVRNHQIQSAIKLILAMQARADDGLPPLRRIETEKKYELRASFYFDLKDKDRPMIVVFNPDQLEAHLPRFDRIMLEAHNQKWQIASLNLLPRHNIPVTFR